MYTVYSTIRSRGFRVLWALEELEQSYELVQAAPQSAEIRAQNPLGKIPALADGDHVLTDSVAIMTYLADKHGALTFQAGTAARARQDAMTLWLIDEFDATLWMAARHSFILPEETRVAEITPWLSKHFGASVQKFASRLEGPFVMGDRFTVADILAVHCLNWAIGMSFPIENDAVLEYGRALRARPGFKAVRALDQ